MLGQATYSGGQIGAGWTASRVRARGCRWLIYYLGSTGYRQKFVGAWNKHELRTLFKVFLPLPTQWRRDKQGFRWVYSWFLRNNRDQVLDLIASSRVLPNRVDVGRMLDAARKDDA